MDEQTYWIPVRMNRPAYSGPAGPSGGSVPSFRSKVLADAGGVAVATVTPAEPAGAVADDVMILWIWLNAPSPSTFVPPAGWTQFYGPQANGGSENYGLWIRRGGSAPSFVCSWTTNSAVECSVTCWSGCVTAGNPYDQLATAATSSANPANPDPPAVTTTLATLVVALGTGLVSAIPWVAPTGYTIRESGGSNWGRVCVASKALPTPGLENPASFTNGSASSFPIWAATMALTGP